jgi:hypothetical protein
MALSDWASVAVTGGLGLAGLYFANSLKRRARQDLDREVAEKRFVAYGSMWTYMIQASPMNAVELAEASQAGSLADAGDAQDDDTHICAKTRRGRFKLKADHEPDEGAGKAARQGDRPSPALR